MSPLVSVRQMISFVVKELTLRKRDDVALALRYLVDRPDANKLAIDMVGGETDIEDGLDIFIKGGISDFLG